MRHPPSYRGYPEDLSSPENRELDTLMRVLHAKDDYTARHCHQVKDLSVTLGKHLRLTSEQMDRTALAALYHDVGKVGITRQVLNKPARLNRHEWRSIRTHPIIGRELVGSLFSADRLPRIIQQHHEAWDGSGYPDGLAGDDILLEAQILHICDVYDALISRRPYRPPYSRRQALRIIEDGKGSDFSPAIVDEFIDLTERSQMAA